MSLFNFKKKTESAPCCCGSDCCTPEEAASETCCETSDCCTPEEAASENCCETSDCCTPEEAASGCCCCDCCAPEAKETERFIKVLGGGCKNCHKLMDNTQEALKSLGLNDAVELVSDMAVIAGYGVMSTPALVVDGKVVSTGRVLSPQQAAEAIQSVRGK